MAEPTSSLPSTSGDLLAKTKDLVAQGKTESALDLAKAFGREAKLSQSQHMGLISDVLMQAGQRDEAIDCLLSMKDRLGPDSRLKLSVLLMQSKRSSEAVCYLPDEKELSYGAFDEIAIRLLTRARVLVSNGDFDLATEAAYSIAQHLKRQSTPQLWNSFATLSADIGLPELCYVAIQKIVETKDAATWIVLNVASLLQTFAAAKTKETLASQIRDIVEQRLRNGGLSQEHSIEYARFLHNIGKPEDAIEALNQNVKEEETPRLKWLRVKILAETGDVALAIQEAQKVLENGSVTGQAQEDLVLLLAKLQVQMKQEENALKTLKKAVQQGGGHAIQRNLALLTRRLLPASDFQKMVAQRERIERAKLPSSLKTGLSEIEVTAPATVRNAGENMRLLWQHSGLPAEKWPEWSTRYTWGKAAAKLMRSWGYYSETKNEVLDLISPIDTRTLDIAMQQGRGAILCGSHMGPVAASFFSVEKLPYNFKFLAAGGLLANTRSEAINLAESSPSKGALEIVRHLKKGGLMGYTLDVAANENASIVDVDDLMITVSTLPARLSWRYSVPTVWVQARWVDQKVHVDFMAYPMPTTSETFEEFNQRWLDAHLSFLRPMLKDAPENVCGFPLHKMSQVPRNVLAAAFAQKKRAV